MKLHDAVIKYLRAVDDTKCSKRDWDATTHRTLALVRAIVLPIPAAAPPVPTRFDANPVKICTAPLDTLYAVRQRTVVEFANAVRQHPNFYAINENESGISLRNNRNATAAFSFYKEGDGVTTGGPTGQQEAWLSALAWLNDGDAEVLAKFPAYQGPVWPRFTEDPIAELRAKISSHPTVASAHFGGRRVTIVRVQPFGTIKWNYSTEREVIELRELLKCLG